MTIPKQFQYLATEPGPRILLEALKTYGVTETPGIGSNPEIMGWAKAVNARYSGDDVPWCALGMSYWALQAGWDVPPFSLSALAWRQFGAVVDPANAMLGDVLIFKRKGGGHVGLYVGETDTSVAVLGANQSDKVCIEWKSKARVFAARRCPWRVNQPANVRKIILNSSGPVSGKEA